MIRRPGLVQLRTGRDDFVIASEAKQSIAPLAETWIASLRSQMTAWLFEN
jgi:hypothetical protein